MPANPLLNGLLNVPDQGFGVAPTNGLAPPNLLLPPDSGAPTQAQGVTQAGSALWRWLQGQRAQSRQMGLLDPATGLPTQAGAVDAARQYANALMMGTTAPRGTPAALKDWFGKSVYVDAHGQPEVMYHGTAKSFEDYQPNLTPDDHVPGISVTPNPGEASSYGTPRPVYVKAEKPMDYRNLEDWAAARAGKTGDDNFSAFDVPPATLLDWLKKEGYDAIDYTSDPNLGYGIRVFDPSQIRPK